MSLYSKIKKAVSDIVMDRETSNDIDYRALFSDLFILDGKSKYTLDIANGVSKLCSKVIEFEQGAASVNELSGYVADVEIQIEKLKNICPELAEVVTLQKADLIYTMFDDVIKRSEDYDE
jgi:hypothetical protein